MNLRSALSLIPFLVLVSCANEVFNQKPQAKQLNPFEGQGDPVGDKTEIPPKKSYSIAEILHTYSVAVPADILFVIDNSGSMAAHQQAVIDNTALFINQFSQIPDLNWKMGLLSSDIANAPFAGFPNTGVLDSSNPNAADIFRTAVGQLGVGGTGRERFYDPIKQAFTQYPEFNRAESILDLVLITDTDDQSDQSSDSFYSYVRNSFSPSKVIKQFGVYNQGPDFACPKTDDLNWLWASSKHKSLIDLGLTTKIYKLCDPNFGKQLLELATDLVLSSARAEIQLQDATDPASLVIKYNGQVLVLGQHYTYDAAANLIRFPNLDFALPDPSIKVLIYYNSP